MVEQSPHTNETEPSPEEIALRNEVFSTPGVRMFIFGTGRGLTIPFAAETQTAIYRKDGSLNRFVITPTQAEIPPTYLEIRNRPGWYSQLEAGTYEPNIGWRALQTQSHYYYIIQHPTRDAGKRDGFKGFAIGWPKEDPAVDQKFKEELFSDPKAIEFIWKEFFENGIKFGLPEQIYTQRNFFGPDLDDTNTHD